MRIISWNCNMAFRKKAGFILKEKPDILIIQESESQEKLKFTSNFEKPNDIFWFGNNQNKGLAIYSYSDFKISKLNCHNEEHKYIIPLSIKNENIEFILIAIWCQNPIYTGNYGVHTWNAIQNYKDLLQNKNVILVGDFNSSSIWDKLNREANHSNIVNFLENYKISSLYHLFYNEKQGKEKQNTLFLQKNIEKKYHIDYCFSSEFFTNKLKNISIGKYNDCIMYSDHMPIIIDFEI